MCRCTIEICLGCWVYSFLGVGLRLKGYVFVQCFDFWFVVRYFRGSWTDFAGIRGFSSVKFVVLRVGVCCGVFVWFLVA